MKFNRIYKEALAVLSAGFVLTSYGNVKTDVKTNNTKVIELVQNEVDTITPGSLQIKKEKKKPKVVKKNFYLKEDINLKDAESSNIIIKAKKYDMGHTIEKTGNTYKVRIKNKNAYINKDKIGILSGTYVVADLSSQTLKIYEGRKKVLETPIVSGTKTKTPSTEGCFKIYSKTRNRYLVGPGYKTYVDIMMKYHGGEGMHDAEYHTDYDINGRVVRRHGWRNKNSFGGTTYLYNGSHGCLNMPHDAAIKAGKLLEVGDKVLVKE